MYSRTRNNSAFWDSQNALRNEYISLQERQNERDKELEKKQFDRYKNDLIKDMKDKVREEEARTGHSGNFLKDFNYGVKEANRTMLKPFNKYIAPDLSFAGPIGSTISSTTKTISGVVDKLE